MAIELAYYEKRESRIDSLKPGEPKLFDREVAQRMGMDTSKAEHEAGVVLLETEFIPDPLTVLRPFSG